MGCFCSEAFLHQGEAVWRAAASPSLLLNGSLMLVYKNPPGTYLDIPASPPWPTLQAQIGATRAAAFDITAACSGFVMGLVTGAQYIRAGTYKTVLVIGRRGLPSFSTARRAC